MAITHHVASATNEEITLAATRVWEGDSGRRPPVHTSVELEIDFKRNIVVAWLRNNGIVGYIRWDWPTDKVLAMTEYVKP